MVLTIPDEVARKASYNDFEALIELACRHYDAELLNHFQAARPAGLQRKECDAALIQRPLPIHRPTIEDIEQDVAALERFDQ